MSTEINTTTVARSIEPEALTGQSAVSGRILKKPSAIIP